MDYVAESEIRLLSNVADSKAKCASKTCPSKWLHFTPSLQRAS